MSTARTFDAHDGESFSGKRKIRSWPWHWHRVFGHGVLHVQIFGADDIKRKEDRSGRANPYVTVRHGNEHNRRTLSSQPHKDGGSNPRWNVEFSFPIRNGGTEDHNILEIDILDHNGREPHNSLGSVRIDGLAYWINKHSDFTTGLTWYPMFYTRDNRIAGLMETEARGRILMKFYFQMVHPTTFQRGEHTELSSALITTESPLGPTPASDHDVPPAGCMVGCKVPFRQVVSSVIQFLPAAMMIS